MKIVQFKKVTKTYTAGDHVQNALSDVDLELDDGRFVVILGPSGAGKSTFLNLLGGLDNPSSGQIIVDDTDISTLSSDELADYRAAKVGFIFQSYNLIPTLTVLENVSLVEEIAPDHMSPEELLDEVGLSDHSHQFPHELSGGEQQRVSICRALAKNPAILLCDEPTGALDYQTGKQILHMLQHLSTDKKMTVVIITHNSALTAMADRVIRVKNGKVISNVINTNPVNVDDIEW